MAAPPDTESLESRINKATNPLNRDTDWDSVQAFCDQLNNDLEGPQLATRLLAHKIQSPQEWEAMQALVVLETCMKSCGERFHSEVGKFRFLNELIKVVSPKYLGTRAPEPVKKKVLELIYSWTLGLPDEAKIADAYQMLKKQGIVKQDPVLPADKLLLLPPPRPKNAIFEDEEKSKTLTRLLNSTHPEDLKAANKLIQEMVQEDQKRAEKLSKRVNAIQDVNESVSLLTQLLEDYDRTTNPQSNAELIQDLYQRCEKMRPTLFRLASDTEDNDEALAEILQANDSLTQVINLYRQQVKGEVVNGNNSANTRRLTGEQQWVNDTLRGPTPPTRPPSLRTLPPGTLSR
uniref:Golgi associated, gamma adaptin ear containing, ARF binding protein 1 n=1 Tax=Hucho hucho TaxID=62062 RepID=A0A4W5PEK9_9TELE